MQAQLGKLANYRWGPACNNRGATLIITLILVIALVVLAAGAIVMTGTEWVLRSHTKAELNLRYLAEMSAEMALSRLNQDESALPDTGFSLIVADMDVEDASGAIIPGIKVSLYSARTGSASGVTGTYASVIGVAEGYGGRSIVRLELAQESFAKYAYFTDVWINGLVFGLGSEYFGPIHSNEEIRIHSTGATFHAEVTAVDNVMGAGFGTFDDGYEEYVDSIPLPDATDFTRLEALATAGNTRFTAPSAAPPVNDVKMRIEFLAIDVNGDLDDVDADEGFFRIYRSPNSEWVGAYGDPEEEDGPWTKNCGDFHDHPVSGDPIFVSAKNHKKLFNGEGDAAWIGWAPLKHGEDDFDDVDLLTVATAGARCFLGGDPRLTLDNQTFDPWSGVAADSGWLARTDIAPTTTLPAALAGRPDADFLIPLHKDYNPDFRGVFFFDGLVGFSGVLNGRVTVASNNTILLLDDFTYAVPANAEKCNDIAGFVSEKSVVVAHNHLNAPRRLGDDDAPWRTYDDTQSEFIDGIILGTNPGFQVENYNAQPKDAQDCLGVANGSGCLFLTGGIIEKQTGITGVTDGRGYIERYSYDSNARFCPPPHFPTTGKFGINRFFEVSPEAFADPGEFFADIR